MPTWQDPVKIVITGGAGQIAYSLLPPLASGAVFGMDQPVILHLLDIPPAITALGGVVMELEDLAYPLLAGVLGTTDPDEAFKDVDYAIFLGAFPRKEGMERKDVMTKNIGIFNSQGSALSKGAKPDHVRFAPLPRNFKGAIKLPDLKEEWKALNSKRQKTE